ncbi:MAG TPA: cobalt ECF transporter T component CbiQ [Syntrophomonadaceae bacterium]|nr:cobalt ECF transporter T component CbiQ [Syntrophomonadaceae bacterium]HRX22025.1 cobalt ECF transporter T component CbiQ [Syntrophomonadaceae bacterium]
MTAEENYLQLPEWMEKTGCQEQVNSSPGRRANFLVKSIRRMKQNIADELMTESFAGRQGILQQLDARLKFVIVVLLVLAVGFVRSIPILLGVWLFTIILMRIARIPVLTMQKRIWGVIPLITLLISIPAMLNIFIDGKPLIMIYESTQQSVLAGIDIPASLYISQQGLTAGLRLCLRIGISLSLGVLLVMTTPAARLFKSMQVMGIPALMVMILEMSYRYLVLLLTLSIEMFEARQLRTVGNLSLSAKREQVGSSIAALFAKSMEMTDEIYLAMRARGYTGQAVYITSEIE